MLDLKEIIAINEIAAERGDRAALGVLARGGLYKERKGLLWPIRVNGDNTVEEEEK